MPVDRDVVNLRLARIEGHLAELEELERLSRYELTADYRRYRRAKAAVSSTVLALASILRHADRATGGKSADPLAAAVTAGWLPADLAPRLRSWLELEPILARSHYEEDRDLIYDLVASGRSALIELARAITAWMDREGIE